jgi:hypothetical protein
MERRHRVLPWGPAQVGAGVVALCLALGCDEMQIRVGEALGGAGGESGLGGAGVTEGPRFYPPTAISELNDPDAKDQDPTLTADLLEIFFFSDRLGGADIWTSRRTATHARWTEPRLVSELSSEDLDMNPWISRDGLHIWFYSSREPIGIWTATRARRDVPFSAPLPVPITVPEITDLAIGPSLDPGLLRMAISIGLEDSRDIYEVVRPSWDSEWGAPAKVAGLSGDAADSTPFLVDDGREILLASGRTGQGDLFWAYRPELGAAVEQVVALDDLNDPEAFESHPHWAVDRSEIYFGSDRSGGTDLFVAAKR